MTHLVSVVMPCLNSENTISEAVESVLKQDYKNIELLVIDDGSTDCSLKILESYKLIDCRIKIFKNTGKHGVSYARNVGISASSGKFICFLDSDDYLLAGSINKRVNALEALKAKIVYGNYLRLSPHGVFSKKKSPPRISFKDMLKKNQIGNLTGMYDSEFFGKIQQYPIEFEDYLMWCQILKFEQYAFSTGSDEIAVYRVSPNSLTGNKRKAFFWHWNILRRGLKINVLFSIYYQLYYLRSSLVDRVVWSRNAK